MTLYQSSPSCFWVTAARRIFQFQFQFETGTAWLKSVSFKTQLCTIEGPLMCYVNIFHYFYLCQLYKKPYGVSKDLTSSVLAAYIKFLASVRLRSLLCTVPQNAIGVSYHKLFTLGNKLRHFKEFFCI
jgi:hypothetical protein